MVCLLVSVYVVFVFKQKTAYEMRISDWSSDVCSSDLDARSGDESRNGDVQVADVVVQRRAELLDLVLPDADLAGPDAELEEAVREVANEEIGRASCRERVCQYV